MTDDVDSILSRAEQSKSIDSLNLSNRGLKMLPARLSGLVNLKSLYLDNNKLIFIPEIGNLVQLEELSLENNEITLMPESCLGLRSLKTLNMSRNSLKCLNGSMFASFDQLTVLWLNECGLMYLPKEIGLLVGLEKLGLKSNLLESLPDEFGSLTRLKWLSLENNLLSDLPSQAFGKLVNLSHLNLNKNKLECVPDFFLSNSSLNAVFLRGNQIKLLSDAHVLDLARLSKVDLRDNPCIESIRENDTEFFRELRTLGNFIITD